MAINRLGVSQPSANTNTLIYTSTRNAIVSIIATNLSTTAATVRTWTVPQGATLPSQYSYHTYDTNLPGSNTLETFRFAIQEGDTIYVRSSTGNVSFSLNGIYESNGISNITVSPTQPTATTIGDVWVNSTTSMIYFWSGSTWILTAGGATGAGTDKVFYENDQMINNSYSITAGKNAGTFGTVSIGPSATVTIPNGSVWTIV